MRIPVRRSGGSVAAHTLVDAEDYERLAAFTWRLKTGYVYRKAAVNGRRQYFWFARVVMAVAAGDRRHVDHINHDTLDNRKANLRVVTCGQNQQNRGSTPGSSSRFRGVSWHKALGRWQARVQLEGKPYYLGLFDAEEQAAEVAAAWRAEHMPYSPEAVTLWLVYTPQSRGEDAFPNLTFVGSVTANSGRDAVQALGLRNAEHYTAVRAEHHLEFDAFTTVKEYA